MVLTLLLLCTVALQARTKHGLGLHFGTLSAKGFSYRLYNGNSGYQATLGAITTKNDDPNFYHTYYGDYYGPQQLTIKRNTRETDINLGLNYLQSLANNRTGRFYVFGGASVLLGLMSYRERDYLMSDPETGTYVLDTDQEERKDSKVDTSFYVGAGMGFDFDLGRGFHWAIELPITVNENTEFTMYIPQTGIYYFFH